MSEEQGKPFEVVGDEAQEARVVSWVLGEATEFEVEEIRRLCREQPELEVFRRRLAAVHGLAGEALGKPEADWKLPPGKRQRVLAVIGAAARDARRERSSRRAARRVLLAVAACLAVTVIVVALVFPAILGKRAWKAGVAPEDATIVRYSAAAEDDAILPAIEGFESLNRESKAKAGISGEAAEGEDKLALRVDRNSSGARTTATRRPAVPAAPPQEPEPRSRALTTLSPVSAPAAPPVATTRPAPSEAPVVAGAVIENAKRAALGIAGGGGGGAKDHAPVPEPVPDLGDLPQTGAMFGSGQAPQKAANSLAKLAEEGAVPAGMDAEVSFGGGLAPADAGDGRAVHRAETLLETRTAGRKGNLDLRNQARQVMDEQTAERTPAQRDGDAPADPFAEVAGSAALLGPAGKPAAREAGGQQASGTRGDRELNELASRLVDNLAWHGEAEVAGGERLRGATGLHEGNARESEAQRQWHYDGADMADESATRYFREKQPAEGLIASLPAAPSAQTAIDLMAEIPAAAEPFSTFSLHVSDASFRVAAAALARGERPDPATVRPEEFYNTFDYGDPAPTVGEPVACAIEQCAHPLLPSRNLVRVAVRTAAAGRAAGQPLRLTVLLDNSGSMEREDRRESVRAAVDRLASLLGPQDVVTVAGFARLPRLLCDRASGDAARDQLRELVEQTPAEGGTNLEQALELAAELAMRQFDPAAQNRIVLLTDGAANLGNADPEALARRIEMLRRRGISFDAAGFGTAGMNDRMLERLSRDGNGRYYVVDGPGDAGEEFAKKLAGAFRPAAENVKVQVRFNPARVGGYRLIGFEEHRLAKEDFRDDLVDAAEMASEEAGVAVYQVELLPDGEGEIGEVSVRFRDAAKGVMVERSWTMPHDESAPAFDRAPASMQVAGLAVLVADALRDGPLAPLTDWGEVAPVTNQVRTEFAGSEKVGQLLQMVERLR